MGDINLKAALGGQIVLTPTNTASNYTATFPAVTGVVSVQASASYTTGSVLFVNSSGQIAQDNANFFWDDTNNRLGIGTASPAYKIDVSGTGDQVVNITTNTSGSPKLNFTAAGVNSGYIQYNRSNAALELGADATNTFYSIDYTGLHRWYKASAGLTMTLDNVGNLGLGVTPSAWGGSGLKAFQVGAVSSLWDYASVMFLTNNRYFDGTNNKYIANGYATTYSQTLGEHRWFTAPNNTSGAGANITTNTQAMTLNSSGVLLIGTATAPSGSSPALVVQTSVGGGVQYAHSAGGGGLILGNSGGGLTFYTYTGAVGSETYTLRGQFITGAATLALGSSAATNPGKVLLYGSTSGSITLQTPAVAGSNTLTFPAATGTVSTTGFAVAMSVVFGG